MIWLHQVQIQHPDTPECCPPPAQEIISASLSWVVLWLSNQLWGGWLSNQLFGFQTKGNAGPALPHLLPGLVRWLHCCQCQPQQAPHIHSSTGCRPKLSRGHTTPCCNSGRASTPRAHQVQRSPQQQQTLAAAARQPQQLQAQHSATRWANQETAGA